jgi:hypothetical protein
MNLTKTLRQQGYDLIDGPVRNHKLLQLWLKKPYNEIQLYYAHLVHAFESTTPLTVLKSTALNIDATTTNEYNFHIGISLLEEILSALSLDNFEISSKIKSGKKITIGYKDAIIREVPIGEIQNYLATSDFKHVNKRLLKNVNRNNILVVHGVLLAKNLVVSIETDFTVETDWIVDLNQIAAGKLDFEIASENKLNMVSRRNSYFPIAIKADRIDFDKGHFNNTKLITDNRRFF